MMNQSFFQTGNGRAFPLAELPAISEEEFRSSVTGRLKQEDCRLLAFFPLPVADRFQLIALLGNPRTHQLEFTSFHTAGRYRSLTPELPQFHWFEREIAEEFPIVPENHPWLKPIRFEHKERIPGITDYFTLTGEAAHEVAVGPVHAGVIEPGHFRFQCVGEKVYSLEIELGYQHRGIEKLLLKSPAHRLIHYLETAAGDTSAGSALTYARLMEGLGSCTVSPASEKLRAIALELERLANHIGDLGALAGDVAFLPTASFCGRIRGEYLNMSAELCGNRFGRHLIVPGGTRYGLEKKRAEKLLRRMERVYPELEEALTLMLDSPTVLDRLENTGTVTAETARTIGMVGVAARASGLKLDARKDFPAGFPEIPASVTPGTGDVVSRARLRQQEIKASQEWLFRQLREFQDDLPAVSAPSLAPASDRIIAAVTEAWRGELCHVAITGPDGKFRRYKIIDPSFHNWFGLALALRGEEISNFPICNKSFNLSYCGHDL